MVKDVENIDKRDFNVHDIESWNEYLKHMRLSAESTDNSSLKKSILDAIDKNEDYVKREMNEWNEYIRQRHFNSGELNEVIQKNSKDLEESCVKAAKSMLESDIDLAKNLLDSKNNLAKTLQKSKNSVLRSYYLTAGMVFIVSGFAVFGVVLFIVVNRVFGFIGIGSFLISSLLFLQACKYKMGISAKVLFCVSLICLIVAAFVMYYLIL